MHYTISCGSFSLAPSEGERVGVRGCSVSSIPRSCQYVTSDLCLPSSAFLPHPCLSVSICGKEIPSRIRLPGIKISDSLTIVGRGPTGNQEHKQ